MTKYWDRVGRRANHFFTKSIGQPAQRFFSKGGEGQQILGGFSKGLGAIGHIASEVASSPITAGIVGAVAPELLPAIPALALGGNLLTQGSQATNIKNYRGNPQQVVHNVLERAKSAQGTLANSGIQFV